MIEKYPHTATITWYPSVTEDANTGIGTEDQTPVTKEQECRWDMVSNRVYFPKLDYDIPDNAVLTILGVTLHISQIVVAQLNVMAFV